MNTESGSPSGVDSVGGVDAEVFEFAALYCPPILSFPISLRISCKPLNCQPISSDVQLQYPQLKIHGPRSDRWTGSGWIDVTAKGPIHIGQLKQFLVHLHKLQSQDCHLRAERTMAYLPTSLALDHARRHLEQAIRTVPCHNFFQRASWTSNLLAILAIQKVLQRV